jgi:hypothetical protein
MRALVAAVLMTSLSAHATLVYERGPMSIRLLDSDCASEDTAKLIAEHKGVTKAKRADIMLAGNFVPACYAFDIDGDVVVMDRKGAGGILYRKAFKQSRDT